MSVEYLIHHKHTLEICVNLNIFHEDIKENVSRCFFLNTVYMDEGANFFTSKDGGGQAQGPLNKPLDSA